MFRNGRGKIHNFNTCWVTNALFFPQYEIFVTAKTDMFGLKIFFNSE